MGAAAALFVTGVVLLACHLAKYNLYALWYALIGVGCFLACAGVSFCFFRVTDGKIARELDKTVGRERVQTALAYQESEGDIYELQRADACEKLAPVKPKFTRLWLFILLPVLTLAVFLCGCLITTNKEPDAADDPYEITDWQQSRLASLILYVKNSQADEDTKEGITAELMKLVNLEEMGVTGSSLAGFVQEAVTNVRSVYTAANGNYTSGENEKEADRAQKRINSEVGEYVVQELYKIFDIAPPPIEGGDKPGTNPNDPTDPDVKDPPIEGGNDGSRELFFDPELGYVTFDVISKKYHDIIDAAMDEGVVDSDEWFDIVMLYFQILEGVR